MIRVKKVIYLVTITVFFLVACQQHSHSKENSKTNTKKTIATIDSSLNIVPYHLMEDHFYRVVGFSSEVEVLLIEQQPEGEQLVQYNLLTGKKKTLYFSKDDIIQAFIHPSMKQILLQTATNEKRATVMILSNTGELLHKFQVKSSEISIVWNPSNANLLALAAFSDDFSYKSYIYESNKEKLHRFQSANPFWTWLTDDSLWMNRMSNNPLNGGTLSIIDWKKNQEIPQSEHKVIYMSCFKQSKIIVTMDFKHEEFQYVLQKGKQKKVWKTPAVSSFSQWFVPEIQWLEDQSMMTLLPMKNGIVDDGEHPFQLVHVTLKGVQNIGQFKNYEPITCSSKGIVCLSGNNYETLISTKSYEMKKWLLLKK